MNEISGWGVTFDSSTMKMRPMVFTPEFVRNVRPVFLLVIFDEYVIFETIANTDNEPYRQLFQFLRLEDVILWLANRKINVLKMERKRRTIGA